MSNTALFALWGALYALCAGLGFLAEPATALQIFMTAASVALFVPPLMLNHRAAKAGDRRTLQLVRNLSGAWLLVASSLLVANLLSVFAGEKLGVFLHSMLVIAASPLVASGSWALSIFLWAYVFYDARAKLKKK